MMVKLVGLVVMRQEGLGRGYGHPRCDIWLLRIRRSSLRRFSISQFLLKKAFSEGFEGLMLSN